MIKKQIYPKTNRVGYDSEIAVTEKLDGSNLCLARLNDELLVCQRKTILKLSEIDEYKGVLYKGLYQWIQEHGEELQEKLWEGAVICGEWLGMGRLKYDFENRFFMFAKANIDEDLSLYNILHDHELFIYPFIDQVIPDYISIVPEVAYIKQADIDTLNTLYADYTEQTQHNVEGFVLNYGDGAVKKYVRMKRGKLEEHKA